MSQLVADCPRCHVQRISFDVFSSIVVGQSYGWQNHWEAFCVCAHCQSSTIFKLTQSEPDHEGVLGERGGLRGVNGSLNNYVCVAGYVSASDFGATPAPQYLPDHILAAFNEGAKCLVVGCYNAAGTMFRLCVDMTTREKLPAGEVEGLNHRTRRDLGLRLPWLFDNRYLPEDLRELSHCIKEDGNDGAHQGTLTEADALDLLDFTTELLERIYTQPEKVRLAAERRAQRRSA